MSGRVTPRCSFTEMWMWNPRAGGQCVARAERFVA